MAAPALLRPRPRLPGWPDLTLLLGSIRPRWSKVGNDLLLNRGRTVLVVLTIWVGVCAIGMIVGASDVIRASLAANGARLAPPSVTLTADPFTQVAVDAVRRTPGVVTAEARRSLSVRAQTPDGVWHDTTLFALPSFDRMSVARLLPQTGAWPPGLGQMLLERSGFKFLGVRQGDRLTLEMPNGLRRSMSLAGAAFDLDVPAASNRGIASAYISMDELDQLGQSRTFNQLDVISANAQDWDAARAVAVSVRAVMENSGLKVLSLAVPQPGTFWANDSINALILMLTALAVLAVFMSSFLIINTTTALMGQQLRQIGVMKAVGARMRQMAGLYGVTIVVFGVLALLLATPIASAGAKQLVAYATRVLNFDALPFHMSTRTLVLELIVALVLPVLAAAGPILGGSRITIREAITGGRGGSGGEGVIARLAVLLDLSGPVAIAISNATRKKLRAAFTMAALITGTATFIAVLSVKASINQTLNERFDLNRYDVELDTSQPYPVAALESQALAVPGVRKVESWQILPAYRLRDDRASSDTMKLIGLNPATDLQRVSVVAGRWLSAPDPGAVVINTDVLKDNPDLRVGDRLRLRIDRLNSDWRVVGLVQGFGGNPTVYATYAEAGAAAGAPLQASRVAVVTDNHTRAGQERQARLLEQRFAQAQLQLSQTWSIAALRGSFEAQWAIVINFLVAMAALMGIVGGLGLAGTMGINVTERTREIGVMRAVGATNRVLLLTVMAEGLLLALLSWVIGLAASFPLSRWFSQAVGQAFIDTPLAYRYSVPGAVLWLAILLAIACLASFVPARRASRLTVRDVLAYEG